MSNRRITIKKQNKRPDPISKKMQQIDAILHNLAPARQQKVMQVPTQSSAASRRGMGTSVYDKVQGYGAQAQSILEKGYGKTLMLHPSVARFAHVYSNPFVEQSARLPAFPLVNSQLTRVYASGKGVLNSNGNGYIAITPGPLIFNDKTSIAYTSGPTAPDGMSFGPATDISDAATNSEFATSDFVLEASNSNKTFRPVAVGIRVRNIGTTLNSAGTCYCLQMNPKTPTDNLLGFVVSDFKTYPGFKEYSFRDSKWHSLTRHITASEDMQYQGWNTDATLVTYSNNDLSTSPASFDNAGNMGIYMSANPNQPFEWEVVGHFEVIGPHLNRRSIARANSSGVEMVTNAFSAARHQDTVTPDHSVDTPPEQKGGWIDWIKKTAETVLPMIPSILAMIL
jgi:hypothetical protein